MFHNLYRTLQFKECFHNVHDITEMTLFRDVDPVYLLFLSPQSFQLPKALPPTPILSMAALASGENTPAWNKRSRGTSQSFRGGVEVTVGSPGHGVPVSHPQVPRHPKGQPIRGE